MFAHSKKSTPGLEVSANLAEVPVVVKLCLLKVRSAIAMVLEEDVRWPSLFRVKQGL